VFPYSARGIRGWAISTLLMDEAAHFLTETEGPQVVERVFNSLVPATAQFGDKARIILSSTPWGQDGLFADMFQRAPSGELKDAAAHHRPRRHRCGRGASRAAATPGRITDQYKAAGVADRLRALGVSVKTEAMAAPTKDSAFGFLKARLRDGSLELYEHADLGAGDARGHGARVRVRPARGAAAPRTTALAPAATR
jgi:hypothetical protein